MNLNLKRHKLLKILTPNKIKFNSPESGDLGISFEHIEMELNCDKDKCELIYSELYTSNEIKSVKNGKVIGLHLTQEGLASYSSAKYRKIFWKQIINTSKDLVHILIPVMSLAITILVIIKDDLKTSKELQTIKHNIELQTKHIKKLELESRKYRLKESENDSLVN